MTREDLKEIIALVIEKMDRTTPTPACGLLWTDEPQVTTLYSVGEEDMTTLYGIGEEG